MTLDTRVRIVDQISPEAVWAKCQELIAAPTDVQFTIKPHAWATGWTSTTNNPGQGLCAWLGMETRTTGTSHIDEAEEETDRGPDCCIEVSFDTAYGYKDAQGRGCGQLHHDITSALGDWLNAQGVRWWALDEFKYEWFERTPCPLAA